MDKFYSLVALMLLYIVTANSQDCTGRPPMQPFNNQCCKINLAAQQEECLKRIGEQWNAFRAATDKDNFKMTDMCASDCFLNNNVITSDNKVNSDELRIVLLEVLGAEWQSLLPNMINTCKDRIDNSNPNEKGPHGNGHGPNSPMANCNMTKEKLLFCVREQFLISCPDSSWKNDEECNNMRSYIKNCPFEKRGGPRGQP